MKEYTFNIAIRYGYGTVYIDAENEDEAYDKLIDFIDLKMKEAGLEIDYDVDLEYDDEDEDEDDYEEDEDDEDEEEE